MTTQNLVIGVAVLVVVLGAWTIYAGKGVPWHQQSQQQRNPGSGQKRQGQQGGNQQQGQSGPGAGQHDHEEEGEGDPADWTEEELKAYLENRGETVDENTETRVMLLARVQDLKNR